MTPKIACPQCGESNYEASPACWACGAPLKGPRAQTPPPEAPPASTPDVVAPEMVAPETAQVETLFEAAPKVIEPMDGTPPPIAGTEATATSDVPPGDAPPSGPKPAEIEAQKLREKDYVTPPVEVNERPKSPGEWIAYAFQALGASAGGFKESLDEYDRRRGHKSGTFSSFGCLVTALTVIITIALMVWILSLVAPGLRM